MGIGEKYRDEQKVEASPKFLALSSMFWVPGIRVQRQTVRTLTVKTGTAL